MVGRDEVRAWLEQDGLSCEQVQDDGAEWHLIAQFPSKKIPVDVICPKKQPHLIIVGRKTTVTKEHQEALSGLSDAAFAAFRFGLVRDLLLTGRAQYRLDIDDGKKLLRAFTITRKVWREGAGPQDLLQGMQDVHDLSLVTVSRIRATIPAS